MCRTRLESILLWDYVRTRIIYSNIINGKIIFSRNCNVYCSHTYGHRIYSYQRYATNLFMVHKYKHSLHKQVAEAARKMYIFFPLLSPHTFCAYAMNIIFPSLKVPETNQPLYNHINCNAE